MSTMAEFENFQYDFVFRTRQIVQDIPADYCYDVTLLLNCLLGLMAYPIEVKKVDSMRNDNTRQFICLCVDKARNLDTDIVPRRGEKSFFKALRNAIAHGYITPHPSGSKVSSITLQDRPLNSSVFDFKITFTIPALKELALYIADQYLTIWPLPHDTPSTIPRRYSRCCWRCRNRSCWKGQRTALLMRKSRK